jgi:uncharacterized protein (TIGR03437 family)
LAVLLCGAVGQAAEVHPLAVQQTRYEMRVGESVQIAVPPETLDFLLKAANLRVDLVGAGATLAAGPNRAHDQVRLAAPLRAGPGRYTAKLSATSPAGEVRTVQLTVVLKPRQQVPTGSTRPPVVLLNGWETGFTGACNTTTVSDTFGNLSDYLTSDGVPVVYYFDNCAVDPNQTIEVLGNDLDTYLNSIKYENGDQVPQIDLVAFSMGGLVARAYLAGLQPSEIATPPATTLVRDLILIATPNFGSYVAGNYATILTAETGTQSAELVPGSSFLWNLATWNQRGDDLRGVNALAIVGNAGPYLATASATTQLNNASDGLVSETSAALGFALLASTPTQVVPYCHVDPSVFTNTTSLGAFDCDYPGIANVTTDTQETGLIVRSFLDGNSDWQSIGVTAANDANLSSYGGLFFGMENQTGSYVTDLTSVTWGTNPGVAMTPGGDTDIVYYTDFVSGSGDFVAVSTSLGTETCGGPLTAPVGYFTAARCKINTAIYDVTPHNAPGWTVSSGSTITLTGTDFGVQCNSCQVLAIPVSSTTQTALQVSSWTNTSISATLPASLTGLVTLEVQATPGIDAITIMAAAPGASLAAAPSSLQFADTAGGAIPAAQSIQISNGGTGTLAWTATSNESWLTVSPASGTAPSTVTVSVSPAGMTAGSYTGAVTITASGASNSPLSVAVTLTVTAAAPSLTVAPQSLAFTYTAGGAVPAAQTVSIGNSAGNSGAGTLTWTATSSQSWLSVSPASGTAPSTVTVSVSPAALIAGKTYTGTIQITAPGASNSPISVAVTLTVAASTATLAVSPQSLTFTYVYTAGGTAPAPQNLSISIGGSGSLSWSAVSSVFWASVSPASGSASATVSVSVNPANLAAGSYTGTVQVVTAASTASVAIALVVQGTQPAGTITGVANGASFVAGFASATWVSIFGTNLSARTASWSAANFVNGALPVSLDGVAVSIDGKPAYVEYISPSQINVLAPDDLTLGTVQVQVTAAGQASNGFPVGTQQFAPAFFTLDGGKYVAAQHSADYSLIGAPGAIPGATPAQPGEIILMYGTGFGPTTPPLPTANQVTTAEPLAANAVQISIGGVPATVDYAGLVESGLYQFNVTVPAGLPSGDAPVVATIGGESTQSQLYITIQ